MPLTSFSIKIAFRWLTTGMMPARIFARSPSVSRVRRRFSTACSERTGCVRKPDIPFSSFSPARRSSTSKLRALRFRAPKTVMGLGISRPSPASETIYWASLRELNW